MLMGMIQKRNICDAGGAGCQPEKTGGRGLGWRQWPRSESAGLRGHGPGRRMWGQEQGKLSPIGSCLLSERECG